MSELEFNDVKNDLLYDTLVDKRSSKNPKILTKSKFLNGLQCPKLLWTRCNAPQEIPDVSEGLQQIFESGNRVGALATSLFPGGVTVGQEDFLKNIKETKALLSSSNPKPIYEAGILAGRLYARADILRPSLSKAGAWDVIEVKCGTKCKDVYLQDIAFQKYCYEQAGLTIDRCFLMHINNQYVRQGDIDVNGLFTLLDVTAEILPFYGAVPQLVDGFLKIIDMPKCPQISIGRHCNKPYECQMKPTCWAFLPEVNVTQLYNDKKGRKFDLLDQGINLLKDIPENYELTENQTVQRLCAVNNRVHVDKAQINDFLGSLQYPLYFMDFETIFEVVPRFDGTHPYQQIPFQFSVHKQEVPGGPLTHFSFLYMKTDDPRRHFINDLAGCIGKEGTVLVYNQTFEQGRLKELAEVFPEYEEFCHDVILMMLDLREPFQKFYYYDVRQSGSASIKKVLPALMGKGYEDLDISGGGQASSEYIRVTYGNGISADERSKVYSSLEAYCALDTKAMVDILDALAKML